MNDCKPSGTPAYGWKRPSRAKTAADHPVSSEPPPKGWGRIKEVFKAFAGRGVVPKWTAYRKAPRPGLRPVNLSGGVFELPHSGEGGRRLRQSL